MNDLNKIIADAKRNQIIAVILIVAGILLTLFLSFIGVVLAVIGIIILAKTRNDLKNKVGNKIAYDVLGKYIEDLNYEPNGSFEESIFDRVEMDFPHYDRLTTNDYISGRYHDMDLRMCDLLLQQRQVHSDGKHTRTTYVTVFQGPFMEVAYDKTVQSPVTLSPKGFSLFNSSIETESEEFNKRFEINCASEHDAFYILTPQMMERIERVHDLAEYDLYINFNKGHLYIGVNNHNNSFELGMFENNAEAIQSEFEDDLKYLLSIIDELMAGFE